METTQSYIKRCLQFFSSYPTYEEWKLLILTTFETLFLCSYPTYEEWKQIFVQKRGKNPLCSYPTYEEWKQETVGIDIPVLDLEGSYPTYEEWKLYNTSKFK